MLEATSMKTKSLNIISLSFAAFLSACASSGPSAGVTPPKTSPSSVIALKGSEWKDWRDVGDIRGDLGPKVKIIQSGKNTIVDLQGAEINGKGMKHSSDSQDENNPGIKNRIPFLTLRDGYIKDLGGGICSYAPNTTFENLFCHGVSEDFVSNQKDVSPNFSVINSKFYSSTVNDKAVQINDFRNALVSGNWFSGGQTSIRAQESSAKNKSGKGLIENNEVVKVPTFLNISGSAEATLQNNKFTDVEKKWVKSSESKVIEK